MVATVGRRITLAWGGVAIQGVREKSVALNGEPIDISSDDDEGWRKLLTDPAQMQVDLSVSGVTKTDALKRDWFDGNTTKTAVFTYPDGGVITGSFYLANYTDTGPYNDAATFEGQFQSSGEVTYTPGA